MGISLLTHPAMLDEVVLFGFDDRAFPFQNHVQKHLIPGGHARMVLNPGPPGSHDEAVLYYGTVLRVGDQLQMWYIGASGPEGDAVNLGHGGRHFVLCYATSSDGIHWEKPELGLVEFNGSKVNNIVDLPQAGLRLAAAILYEPEDVDRPYKLAYEATVEGRARFCVAFSQDGLRWQPSPHNPVGPFLEMAGITCFQGMYYVAGQGALTAHSPVRARQLIIFASKDFEYWSPCGALGLNRSPDQIGPSNEYRTNHIEEIHLGAGLWNRGNVILGVYGQWHGHPSGDRRFLTMDLGLALSHDALHYVEPIPDFALIAAREQPGSPLHEFPALMQGQGMENIGDVTCCWYSLWKANAGTGVRLVTWERDRLGKLQPFHPADARSITCLLHIQGRAVVYANVSGLGEYSSLEISILDEGFRPINGYTGAMVHDSGLRTPIHWEAGQIIENQTIRLDVRFAGIRPEDAQLHALYVVAVDG